ncbi:MAG TPA: hypothetical protein DCR55_00035 [Lentisphaeria bacterium]|nr:hypothetical protein [Lentisphaeria bacterium]
MTANSATFVGQLLAILEEERDTGHKYVEVSPENLQALSLIASAQPPRPVPPATTAPVPDAPPKKPVAHVPSQPRPIAEVLPQLRPVAARPASMPTLEQVPEIAALSELFQQDTSCPSCARAEQRSLGRGPARADLAIVSARPQQDEVGAAGELLEKMLGAMNLTRRSLYFTSTIRCQPDFVDVDIPDTIPCCTHYLRRELELVRPKVILLFGSVPLQVLFQKRLENTRGTWLELDGIPCLATYPPSYLLFMEQFKRTVWADLKLAMARIAAE